MEKKHDDDDDEMIIGDSRGEMARYFTLLSGLLLILIRYRMRVQSIYRGSVGCVLTPPRGNATWCVQNHMT